MDEDELATRQG